MNDSLNRSSDVFLLLEDLLNEGEIQNIPLFDVYAFSLFGSENFKKSINDVFLAIWIIINDNNFGFSRFQNLNYGVCADVTQSSWQQQCLHLLYYYIKR